MVEKADKQYIEGCRQMIKQGVEAYLNDYVSEDCKEISECNVSVYSVDDGLCVTFPVHFEANMNGVVWEADSNYINVKKYNGIDKEQIENCSLELFTAFKNQLAINIINILTMRPV
jgi:hypothetical protein